MRALLPVPVLFLLFGCGMKGDLYETPPPAGPAASTEPVPEAEPEPASGDPDKGERRTVPATPDPASSR